MYGKMQESGLTETILLMCASASWGQNPVLSQSWVPSGCTVGGGCSSWPLDGGHPVSIPSSLGAPGRVAVKRWLDGCSILCFLMWQVILFIHSSHSGFKVLPELSLLPVWSPLYFFPGLVGSHHTGHSGALNMPSMLLAQGLCPCSLCLDCFPSR